VYRRMRVLTVSHSTEEDLRRLGFSGPISVIPEGVEPISLPTLKKESRPTFLYVGRLSPSKRVADVIKAFALFRGRSPGQLWIAGVGSPDYLRLLFRLADRLDVAGDVKFFGGVSNDEKHILMARLLPRQTRVVPLPSCTTSLACETLYETAIPGF
jgi:glycosyltransferase involved in cell wall biosynthesis